MTEIRQCLWEELHFIEANLFMFMILFRDPIKLEYEMFYQLPLLTLSTATG